MTTDTVVTRSGFPWDDTDWRYLAHSDTHYGYGPTPEAALEALAECEDVRSHRRSVIGGLTLVTAPIRAEDTVHA